MKWILLIFPLFAARSHCFQALQDSFQNEDMLKYAASRNEEQSFTYCGSTIYADENSSDATDMASRFISRYRCPIYMTSNLQVNSSKSSFDDQEHFVFLDSIESIPDFVDELVESLQWNHRQHFHFIICNDGGDIENLRFYLDIMWKKGLYYYVVAVWLSGNLKIVTYNPFKGELVDIGMSSTWKYFKQHLKNLHGYKVQMVIFELPPTLQKIDGEWIGDDIEKMNQILTILNGSSQLRETEIAVAWKTFVETSSDFSATSTFQILLTIHNYTVKILADTLFCRQNKMVVLVPDGFVPQYLLAFSFYNDWVGITSLVTLLTVTIFYRILTRYYQRRHTLIDAFIDLWRILLQGSAASLHRYPKAISRFLFGCILFSFFFNAVILSTMLSNLINPKKENIKTLSELKESGLDIYATVEYAGIISENYGLCDQVKIASQVEMDGMLKNRSQSAFVMKQTAARYYQDLIKPKKHLPSYHVVEESILDGQDAFIFRKNSPYLKTFQYLMLIIRSSLIPRETKETTETVENEKINLHDLQAAFLFLFSGYMLTFVVFFSEVIRDNCMRRKLMYVSCDNQVSSL
ncbi:hypothetical protein JTB14_005441 [Gonioctena quinquepunctata]|nr:hypothetical protein JTB14_005441 [Gonioctena quinquepunctata]